MARQMSQEQQSQEAVDCCNGSTGSNATEELLGDRGVECRLLEVDGYRGREKQTAQHQPVSQRLNWNSKPEVILLLRYQRAFNSIWKVGLCLRTGGGKALLNLWGRQEKAAEVITESQPERQL